jgi:uncharacterized peroxidase-related enzyme
VQRDDWLERVLRDWRTAGLAPVDAALCAFAAKLTHAPARMQAADVAGLRAAGLSDVEIHDAVQVVSYFNYINRVADALHVDLEPEMEPYPEPG